MSHKENSHKDIYMFKKLLALYIHVIWLILLTNTVFAASGSPPHSYLNTDKIQHYCQEFSQKLKTVTYEGCLDLGLKISHHKSVENRLLTYREILPVSGKPPQGRVLLISGIHGDEFTAISIGYLWLQTILANPEINKYQWLFLPLTNPDGLLHYERGQRQNSNGVDLNRNFPSPDWDELALKAWVTHARKNKRRYPGPSANSEPETQWMTQLIRRYKPDAIISLHAPFGLVDYDGPQHARPDSIGNLQIKTLGTFPGSLGRFAGEYLDIPVLTIELDNAGTMPKEAEILQMWQDIETWIAENIKRPETDF